MTRKTLIASLVVPALLLGLVAFQALTGGNALPAWISTISIRLDQDPLVYLRLIMMLELTLALLALVLGSRAVPVAWIALALVGFSATAETSALLSRNATGAAILPILLMAGCLTVGGGLLGPSDPVDPKRRTRPLRWVGAVVAMLVTASVLANIPLAPRTAAEGRRLAPATMDPPAGVEVHSLDVKNWEGLTLAETNLGGFLPDLLTRTGEGRSVVALYNRGCGECHEFFEVHLSEGYELPVIAVEVPHADGAMMAPGVREDDVVCPDCHFTTLPGGPLWLVTTPAVLIVEDGRIVCVSEGLEESCLERS